MSDPDLQQTVASVKTCRLADFGSRVMGPKSTMDPKRLAMECMDQVGRYLGLPGMRLEWADLGNRPVYFDGATPMIIYLGDKHLLPEYTWLIPRHIGHVLKHADLNLGVRHGRYPIEYVLDDDRNERMALAFGRIVGARWSRRS